MKGSVAIEKDEHGYYAFSPELEGCQSEGATFEHALANIREAVELFVATLPPAEAQERVGRDIITKSVEVVVG
jgi:predicted RNase H-like HicB family nuclease